MKMKVPAWLSWLDCVLLRGGHSFGRWWWPERPEAAHRLCEDCAAMQTPKNRRSWFSRERTS